MANFIENGSICVKCKELPAEISFRIGKTCKNCFIENVEYKFKGNLRRSIQRNENVVVAFSGGENSRMMLDLVSAVLNGAGRSRMFFNVTVVHINELESLESESIDNMEKIAKIVEGYGFPFHNIELSRVFSSQPVLETTEDNSDKLKCLLSSIKTLEGKEDLIQHFRTRLLVQFANEINSRTILIGTTLNRVSENVIKTMCKRGGFSLPLDVVRVDTRFIEKSAVIVSPLREFESKESSFYCKVKGLEHVLLPNFRMDTDSHCSINAFTEELVSSMQDVFPSFAHNVFNTTLKLDVAKLESKSDHSISFEKPAPPIEKIEEPEEPKLSRKERRAKNKARMEAKAKETSNVADVLDAGAFLTKSKRFETCHDVREKPLCCLCWSLLAPTDINRSSSVRNVEVDEITAVMVTLCHSCRMNLANKPEIDPPVEVVNDLPQSIKSDARRTINVLNTRFGEVDDVRVKA